MARIENIREQIITEGWIISLIQLDLAIIKLN